MDNITIREVVPDDIKELAAVCMAAFNQGNASVALPPEFGHIDELSGSFGMIAGKTMDPNVYGICAYDEEQKALVGGVFGDFNDDVVMCGPFFALDSHHNAGLARKMIEMLLAEANKRGRTNLQLCQLIPNVKSFSLYFKLGWVPTSVFCTMTGFVAPEMCDQVEKEQPEWLKIRAMAPEYVESCDALFQECKGGRSRKNNIAMLTGMKGFPFPFLVAVDDRSGKVCGYSLGMFLGGHTVANSTQVFTALVVAGSKGMQAANLPPEALQVHVPPLNPEALKWCYSAKMQLRRQGWLMAIGEYHAPKDGFVYCPSIES